MAKTIKYRKNKKPCKKGGTTPRKNMPKSSSKLTLKLPSPPRPRRVPSRPNLSLINPNPGINLFSSSSPPRRGVPPPPGMNLSLQNPEDMTGLTDRFNNTLKLDSESSGNTTKSDKPTFNFDNVEDPNKPYYNLNRNSSQKLSQPGWVRYEGEQPKLELSDKERLLELEKRTLELELELAARERNKHIPYYADPVSSPSQSHIAVQPIKTPTPKQSPAVGFHLSAIKSDKKSSGLRTKRGRSLSQSPSRPATANLFNAPSNKKTRKNPPK